MTFDLSVKTSLSSSRKYPNVMWFPRSKTDPQEIREVLKLAFKVQSDNPEKFFNDKLLGEHMARIGSINIVGMLGDEYVESYQGKSIGDVSYITNARMLMRVFRFLGLVTRPSKGKYVLTELGKLYTKFHGDFPVNIENANEEKMLLQSLGDFAFYSVNDDSTYRDASFKVRPFIWLLNTLALEPQCIYQLIVTSFASKSESINEVDRIKHMLKGLKSGSTTLKEEFSKTGLDADDYSCVHNFYDSAKILVYLGTSLGLIDKTENPGYGRKISGNAKHLKQASVFYTLTEKGKTYLDKKIKNRLIYYEDVFRMVGNDYVLVCSFILASLNTVLANKKVKSIKKQYLTDLLGVKITEYVELLKDKLQINISTDNGYVKLEDNISFNFYQSIPPEFTFNEPFAEWHDDFITTVINNPSDKIKIETTTISQEFTGKVTSEFKLDENISYKVPTLNIQEAEAYIKYADRDNVFGGQDRFASRISPTNSVLLVGDKLHVDNGKDALDLLVPLRNPDEALKSFISANINQLVSTFLKKSDTWGKDQHYTWIRNCFRQFGAEAIYSGSGGMLSRADVSITSPFLGGIEAKSPTENRGSINTKAIRQAVDAKVQVGHKYPEKKSLPNAAIAVGRRITPLAIEEEKKWRNIGQPVLLISDVVLYYLTLKSISIPLSQEDVLQIFTRNIGVLDLDILKKCLDNVSNRILGEVQPSEISNELSQIENVISDINEGGVED